VSSGHHPQSSGRCLLAPSWTVDTREGKNNGGIHRGTTGAGRRKHSGPSGGQSTGELLFLQHGNSNMEPGSERVPCLGIVARVREYGESNAKRSYVAGKIDRVTVQVRGRTGRATRNDSRKSPMTHPNGHLPLEREWNRCTGGRGRALEARRRVGPLQSGTQSKKGGKPSAKKLGGTGQRVLFGARKVEKATKFVRGC